MSPPTVLIVGCGVAGPVLANLLKRKGYLPIVFEKVHELGDAGASLMLMPNGMKVLNLVGLADQIKKESLPLTGFWDGDSTGTVLGESCIPSTFTEKYSQPAMGVKRTTLNLMLKNMVLDLGIEVREGWQLLDVEETGDSVTAFFNGNRSVTGSFLIGCDGIKAASRKILLGRQGIREGIPAFTGLTQTAGISRTPEDFLANSSLRNWYGQGAHVIAYPVSQTLTSWAITLPETKEKEETWRLYNETERDAEKKRLVSVLDGWEPALSEMITTADRVIKFGLFDRDELRPDQWHSKRCVLVGDAAHPTSPHLGQGANQALEDCYHLSHSMPYLVQDSPEYTQNIAKLGENLPRIFRAFAEKRQPRTSALVRGARAQGEKRVVVGGPVACKERDRIVSASWKDPEGIAAKYDSLCRGPFEAT